MFTGIIQAVGRIRSSKPLGGDCRLTIETAALPMADTALGDSIAVNGVCLTAVELGAASFTADVSNETLALTSLGKLQPGSAVNLEKALTLATPLGGHLVSGHVDGLAEVVRREDDARSVRFVLRAPENLSRYIAAKGSVCIDGTSLTVNAVQGQEFELNIVPHTLAETIMGSYQAGSRVNLEVDLIARYLERLLQGGADAAKSAPQSESQQSPGITEALLRQTGIIK